MSEKKKKAVRAKDYFINRKKSSPPPSAGKKKEIPRAVVNHSVVKAERTVRLNNGHYLATVVGYDDELKGIAEVGGVPCEVIGGIAGEREEIAVVRKEQGSPVARFVGSESPSPFRRAPLCPHFGECGNCDLQHFVPEAQSALKKNLVEKALPEAKGLTEEVVCGKEYGYRNKVHLAFGEEHNRIYVGFFSETDNRVTEVRRCPLHGKWFSDFADAVVRWAKAFNLHAYKPYSGKGLLRFAAARYRDGNLLVTIVATSGKISGLERLYRSLLEKFRTVGLYVLENKGKSPDVMAGELRHVAGEKTLKGELLGVSYELSPRSFYQVNEEVAERAYADILAEISSATEERVIDCFSGIGITSVLFAKSGKAVTSVEIEKDAVRDAAKLIAVNGVKDRVKALCGDVFKLLPGIGKGKNSVFFVDPPRKGLGPEVCSLIAGFAPSRIVYLSCNPVTLGEDVRRLLRSGYALRRVRPYDFFPQTRHVEVLAVLTRKASVPGGDARQE